MRAAAAGSRDATDERADAHDARSGLTYTPGMYASTAELAVLCRVLADEYSGAFYAPHHRGYGRGAMGHYGEMLGLAAETGCPVRECDILGLALALAG